MWSSDNRTGGLHVKFTTTGGLFRTPSDILYIHAEAIYAGEKEKDKNVLLHAMDQGHPNLLRREEKFACRNEYSAIARPPT